MSANAFSIITKHVWTEPRVKAELEWHREYSISAQLMRQVPREELEAYVVTGQHSKPDRRLSFECREMPDFDWWEPRHDQLWRRKAARDRELAELLRQV